MLNFLNNIVISVHNRHVIAINFVILFDNLKKEPF